MITPNKRIWDVGDIVIHECDDKIRSKLMKVIDVFDNGTVKTVYIHPEGNVEFYQYYMSCLYDPIEFGMTATLSFPQELEWRIENLGFSINDPGMDVDLVRYLKGQRSGIRIALDIYNDSQR